MILKMARTTGARKKGSGNPASAKKRANGGHQPKAEAPLSDDAARRLVLQKLGTMSQKKLFEVAVRAGIYTESGKLTKPYRDDRKPTPTG